MAPWAGFGLALLQASLLLAAPLAAQDARHWRVDGPSNTDGTARAAARALVDAPDDPGLAARIWRRLGTRLQPALLRELRRLAHTGHARTRALASGALGQTGLLAGQLEDAAAAFSTALATLPDRQSWHLGLAEAVAGLGRPQEAAAALERVLEKTSPGPGRDALLQALARHRGQAGDPSAALDAWLERYWPARSSLGEKAAASLRTVPVRARGRAGALDEQILNDAVASLRLFDLEKRLRTASDPASVELHTRALQLLGDLAGAKARALQFLSNHPRDRAAALRALALCEAEADWAAARAVVTRLVAAHPRDLPLVLRLLDLELHRSTGADHLVVPTGPPAQDAARALFRATLARFRGDVQALTTLADFATGTGRDELALTAWQAVLRLQPRSLRAFTSLGEIHYQRGRRELARATWSRIAGGARARPEARLQLAHLLADHDFLDEALAHVERVLSAAESLAALRLRAKLEERKQQPAAAIATWRLILERASARRDLDARREARARLLTLVAQAGPRAIDSEITRAQAACETERRCDADDLLYLVALERAARRPQRALALLEGARDRFLDSPALVNELYEHYRQSGQVGDATHLLERLAEADSARAAWAFARLTELAQEHGQREAALDYARRGLAHSPGDPTLNTWLAELGAPPARDEAPDGLASALAAATGSRRARVQAVRVALVRGQSLSAFLAPAMGERRPPHQAALVRLGSEGLQLLLTASELSGTLVELEHALALEYARSVSNTDPALVELHAEVLTRLVPALYQRADDEVAARTLSRISQLALGPLLSQLRERPRAQTFALLGMLGRSEAVPELMRHARTALERAARIPDFPAPRTSLSADNLVQVFIAFGRLGDPRPRRLLLDSLARLGPAGQAAALWALGRLAPDAEVGARDAVLSAFDTALGGERPGEPAAIAALALARSALVAHEDAIPRLASIALDPAYAVTVRRAAALGLAIRIAPDAPAAWASISPDAERPERPPVRGEPPSAALEARALAALSALLKSEHAPLRRTAARTLAGAGTPLVVASLWRSALGDGPSQQDAALRALLAPRGPLPDEARLMHDTLRAEPVLAFLERAWEGERLSPVLVVEHQALLGTTLTQLLDTPNPGERVAVLRALARHLDTILSTLPASESPLPDLRALAAPALHARLGASGALPDERRLAVELLARLGATH